jgi:hypothetical protein
MQPVVQDSNALSFEAAIAQTQHLLAQVETNQYSDLEIEQAIAQLVQTENGARGFFVTYLTDDRAFADQATPGVVKALRASPEIVSELLVKNLAMSSAMAVYHRRQQDDANAQGSDRVRARTAALISQLANLPLLQEKSQQLLKSAETGMGEYQSFLERWGYDAEQRQVIQTAFQQVLTS